MANNMFDISFAARSCAKGEMKCN